MIPGRTLIDFIFAEPFRPFRLHMASGRTFQIDHPERIKVGRTSVTVHSRPDENLVDPWQEVSLMLLESVEPIPTKSETELP